MAEEKETKKTVFETLSAVDISDHVDQKMGLSYLSWAWAWNAVKRIYPDTPTPKVTKYQEMILLNDGSFQMTDRQVPYLTTPRGTSVEVTVTIAGNNYTQSLFVMGHKNQTVVNPDQAEINKTIQRCTVKALAMAGLGLNLYAGEDLPMGDINTNDAKNAEKKAKEKAISDKIGTLKHEYITKVQMLAKQLNLTAQQVENEIKQKAKITKDMAPLDQWQAVINAANDMMGKAGMVEQNELLEEA